MAMLRTQKKENPFVMLDKRALEDTRLSWEAKGLHSYLMSKPDDWTVNVTHLIKQSRNGRDAVYRVVNELIAAGYIQRLQITNEDGKFQQMEYIVYEVPLHTEPFELPKRSRNQQSNDPFPEKPDAAKPLPEKPDTVKPDTEKPYISNNEITKNEITNIDDDDYTLTREQINLSVFEQFKDQLTKDQYQQILNRIPAEKKTHDYQLYLITCVNNEIDELNRKAAEQYKAAKGESVNTQGSKPVEKGQGKTNRTKQPRKPVIPVVNLRNSEKFTIDEDEYAAVLAMAEQMDKNGD